MDNIESDMNMRNEKERTLLWVMTAEEALEFYDRCLRTESITKVERINILNKMAEEGKIKSAMSVAGNPDDVVKDLSKVAKIMRIKKKEE